MRVLLINTSERMGGAAVSCCRLMEALKNNGIKAKMLVRDKQTDEITVVGLNQSWKHLWNFLWERIMIWKTNSFRKNNLFSVDIANTGTDITNLPEFKQADIIHLHWINQGMLSLNGIKKILSSGKPVVWTMHDMWPCTGICHHARDCEGYHNKCGNCPYIYGNGSKKDLSYRIFKKKKDILKGNKIAFIACSNWMRKQAEKSELLCGQQITTIPNTINTNLFKPRDKQEARRECGLLKEMKLMLFGSVKITDKRKGIDYLVESCKILADRHPELKETLGVVTFGNNSEQLKELIPFKVFPQDFVTDNHLLINIYNSVDIFVTPSIEENLPNTIMEAMACGVPCVGFNIGGIPEMIDHLHNGYVAQYKSSDDFANGIYWLLTEPSQKSLSEEAVRKVATHYSESAIAKKHIDLYNKLTDNNA